MRDLGFRIDLNLAGPGPRDGVCGSASTGRGGRTVGAGLGWWPVRLTGAVNAGCGSEDAVCAGAALAV